MLDYGVLPRPQVPLSVIVYCRYVEEIIHAGIHTLSDRRTHLYQFVILMAARNKLPSPHVEKSTGLPPRPGNGR
jgi:hypothetical protein